MERPAVRGAAGGPAGLATAVDRTHVVGVKGVDFGAWVVDPRTVHAEELDAWARSAVEDARRAPLPPIRVLVWGPGRSADQPGHTYAELHRKRVAIVDELRGRGLAATTSEELRDIAGADLPLQSLERLHATEADFVVLLLSTPGTVGELAGVVVSRQVARRTAVFVPAAVFAGGYLDLGPLESVRRLVTEVAYDEDDMQSCRIKDVAVRLAVDQALSLRGTLP